MFSVRAVERHHYPRSRGRDPPFDDAGETRIEKRRRRLFVRSELQQDVGEIGTFHQRIQLATTGYANSSLSGTAAHRHRVDHQHQGPARLTGDQHFSV